MASHHNILFLLCSLLLVLVSPSIAKTPKAIILQATKDESTKLHLTTITQKNPPASVKLLVDLGAQTLWVDCQKSFNSSTYKHVKCKSSDCKLADSTACGDGCHSGNELLERCIKDTCFNFPANPLIDTAFSGGVVAEDAFLFQSTDGSKPGKFIAAPKFIFTCVPTFLAQGLPGGAIGLAGLGRSNISLPTQLAKTFKFPRKFGVCLSSSTKSKGFIILGDGPSVTLPKTDVSKDLLFTPLIANQLGGTSSHSVPAAEYFIGVKSIRVNGKTVKIDKKLLSFNKEGEGGTKINTYSPYTVLDSTIYKALTEAFVKELKNASRVAAVAPFGVCFSSKGIASTRVGPAVPPIDLVLQNKNVFWRIFGANSMVQVSKDVMCLGFVEKAEDRFSLGASIDIGAHQIEDNLLQFDLAGSILGFSSSLLFRQTRCANFNFGSTP